VDGFEVGYRGTVKRNGRSIKEAGLAGFKNRPRSPLRWLGEETASEQGLLALLNPCPDEALKIWSVDKMVGNVRNNGSQLILPVRSKEEVPA
jgi:hypothetical protein